MEEQEISNEYKKQITKLEEVSIFVKIFAYILYKIHSAQKESNINNGDDPKFNLFFIEDILIFMEKPDKPHEKKKFRTNSWNSRAISNIDYAKDEPKKDENINKYQSELIKSFKESYEEMMTDKNFLKNNLFEKEKKYRLNKKASSNISFFTSPLQFYNFTIPKKNRMYNLDFVLNCEKHEENTIYDFSCINCSENFFYFYNTYVIVYDLLVKYFYLPEKLSLVEKELYIGFYL